MGIGKLWFCRLRAILLSIIIISLGSIEAAPQAKKGPTKPAENSPIVGELDESDALPPADGDDDVAVDEVTVTPLTPPGDPKLKGSAKNKREGVTPQVKDKKAEEKRKKLLEEFKKAEGFHKTWYNLPIAQIKTSLEKLTTFCKSTCTKKQCTDDEEVAHNCHLICPDATTKLCPDPLKKMNDKDMENAEAMHMLTSPASSVDQVVDPSSDPDHPGDAVFMDSGGEGE